MRQRTRHRARLLRTTGFALLVALLVAGWGRIALCDVLYMPDVTEQMSDPTYWSNKVGNPHTVLADQDTIADINDAILHEAGTCMNDLASWEEGTYDGKGYAQALKSAAEADASTFYWYYYGRYYWDDAQGKGVYMSTVDEAFDLLYGEMVDNAARTYEEGESTEEPILFGICTTRTCIHSFPSNASILDAVNDPDFDYQYQTAVRVGEPLVIQGMSKDGEFYHVFSSCSAGWVPAADVAVCANKDEWLEAWQFTPEETLVVYDDKIVTEESFYAPAASQKMLSMGTCLKLATPDEYDDGALLKDINRAGYNCHVVWLPVRADDGSYDRMLALISEHCKVSEGYLPLTYANISQVALNMLGDEYGWGGMLSTEDCSGYVRDVYKCFGLELARNTTWQALEPVRSYNLRGMTTTQRKELLRTLPLGTALFFDGHEMLYLGYEGDNLYVLSMVSSASVDGAHVVRLRGGILNTLEMHRGGSYSFITWLDALTTANIPYLWPDEDPLVEEISYACKSGADAQWYQGTQSGLTFVFERNSDGASTFDHFQSITIDSQQATADVDYTAIPGSVIVELSPSLLDSLKAGPHSLVASFDDASDVAVGFTTLSQPAPGVTTYTVSVESSGGGFAGVSTAAAPEGTDITVTVRPFEGHVLQSVVAQTAAGSTVTLETVDGTTRTLTMPADDVVVRASFAIAGGTISSEVVAGKGAPQMTVSNMDAIAASTLTSDDKAAVESGSDCRFWLQSTALSDSSIPKKDKEALEKAAEKLGATPGVWVDLSLYKQIGESDAIQIDKAADPLSLTVEVPASLQKKNRRFWLLRYHDGATATVAEGAGTALSGSSDQFSTYLLAYRDGATSSSAGTASSAGTRTTATSSPSTRYSSASLPSTGDPSQPIAAAALAFAGLACAFAGVRMRRGA